MVPHSAGTEDSVGLAVWEDSEGLEDSEGSEDSQGFQDSVGAALEGSVVVFRA